MLIISITEVFNPAHRDPLSCKVYFQPASTHLPAILSEIWTIPAEFGSNPNQTHLSMLIRIFKIGRKSQVGEFVQGWS